MSYHGADHAADVDGVTASRDVVSRVLQVFGVEVQYLHTDIHHGTIELGRRQEKLRCSYTQLNSELTLARLQNEREEFRLHARAR